MSGIDRPLQPDPKHIAKHLPNTPQMQKRLGKEGFVHVFNDAETLQHVTTEILSKGEFTGRVRGHERYGLYFAKPIGYRLSQTGQKIPLHYGEMKIKGDKYHVIPRTKPS